MTPRHTATAVHHKEPEQNRPNRTSCPRAAASTKNRASGSNGRRRVVSKLEIEGRSHAGLMMLMQIYRPAAAAFVRWRRATRHLVDPSRKPDQTSLRAYRQPIGCRCTLHRGASMSRAQRQTLPLDVDRAWCHRERASALPLRARRNESPEECRIDRKAQESYLPCYQAPVRHLTLKLNLRASQ